MRIGIDCRTILNPKGSERAGVAHYSYYLVKYLLQIDKENEYLLFFLQNQEVPKEFEGPNVVVVYFSKKTIPFWYPHFIFAKEIARGKLDIFHSLSGILPLFYNGPSVITIADLSMYVNPEWFKPKKIIGDFFWRKILIPRSIKKAEKIIAISESTKNDIVKFFVVQENKIEVVYLGVELPTVDSVRELEILEKFKLSGKKYFLFVGTIEPRKNIINIVKAFEEFINRYDRSNKSDKSDRMDKDDHYLVIAGGLGWKYEPILKTIENSTAKEQIKYVSYVNAEEKAVLLKNAQCFVWPSFYEGFGLPILEAMACGVPVITSKTSSIPEVAGNAAIMVDPNDSHAISQAIYTLSIDIDKQRNLREFGRERVKLFSWDKTARRTLEIYHSMHYST